MYQETGNKAIPILQTSLIVSVLVSLTAAYFNSFLINESWSDYLLATYLMIVNKTLFPIGLITIGYCLIIQRLLINNLFRYLLLVLLLSVGTLLLIFSWNAFSICITANFCIPTGRISEFIEREFLLSLLISIPISILIMVFFRVFSARK